MQVLKHFRLRIKNHLILHCIGLDGASEGWGDSEGRARSAFTRGSARSFADGLLSLRGDTAQKHHVREPVGTSFRTHLEGAVEPGRSRFAVPPPGGVVPALSEQDRGGGGSSMTGQELADKVRGGRPALEGRDLRPGSPWEQRDRDGTAWLGRNQSDREYLSESLLAEGLKDGHRFACPGALAITGTCKAISVPVPSP